MVQASVDELELYRVKGDEIECREMLMRWHNAMPRCLEKVTASSRFEKHKKAQTIYIQLTIIVSQCILLYGLFGC
jgi:hypothetical protein